MPRTSDRDAELWRQQQAHSLLVLSSLEPRDFAKNADADAP